MARGRVQSTAKKSTDTGSTSNSRRFRGWYYIRSLAVPVAQGRFHFVFRSFMARCRQIPSQAMISYHQICKALSSNIRHLLNTRVDSDIMFNIAEPAAVKDQSARSGGSEEARARNLRISASIPGSSIGVNAATCAKYGAKIGHLEETQPDADIKPNEQTQPSHISTAALLPVWNVSQISSTNSVPGCDSMFARYRLTERRLSKQHPEILFQVAHVVHNVLYAGVKLLLCGPKGRAVEKLLPWSRQNRVLGLGNIINFYATFVSMQWQSLENSNHTLCLLNLQEALLELTRLSPHVMHHIPDMNDVSDADVHFYITVIKKVAATIGVQDTVMLEDLIKKVNTAK